MPREKGRFEVSVFSSWGQRMASSLSLEVLPGPLQGPIVKTVLVHGEKDTEEFAGWNLVAKPKSNTCFTSSTRS